MLTTTDLSSLPRGERKRLITKDKLLVAAQKLVLQYGLDEMTVNQITEEADVGLGTFYNYFKTKNDVVDGVIELMTSHYHKEVDLITEGVTDPAEVLAKSAAFTYKKVIDGTKWGWMVFDSGVPIDRFSASLRMRGMKDVRVGIEQGVFKVDDPSLAMSILTGMTISITHDIYRGLLPKNVIRKAIKAALIMLGVAAEEAEIISKQPIKKVTPKEVPISIFD